MNNDELVALQLQNLHNTLLALALVLREHLGDSTNPSAASGLQALDTAMQGFTDTLRKLTAAVMQENKSRIILPH